MYEDLLESLKSNSGISWDLLERYCDYHPTTTITTTTTDDEPNYLSVCQILLSRLDPTLISDERHEIIFNRFLIKNTVDGFMLICNSLLNEKEASFKRDKYFDLVKKYIFDGNTLKSIMVLRCEERERQLSDRFETILMSLPERISNMLKLKTPQIFMPLSYFNRLCKVLFDCLCEFYKRIREEKPVNMSFLASISGRVCLNGFAEVYWNRVLKPVAIRSKGDFIWRRIAHRLVELQDDRNLEAFVKGVVCFSPSSTEVSLLFADMVEKREKLKFLLTNKLLLVSCFENKNVLKNIMEYLVSSSKDSFLLAVLNVLNAWGNALSVKHRSNAQNLYLSATLVIASAHLKKMDCGNYRQTYLSSTIHGIQVYLKCPLMEVRNTGLFVGQLLTSVLQDEGPKLDLEIEQTPDIKMLIELTNEKENDPKLEEESVDSAKKREQIIAEEKEVDAISKTNLDSDDDEDDLIPYDMSCDTPLQKYKKPVYLRDCMDGLIEQDKPDWTSLCLQSAAQVIRTNSETVAEVAAEFVKSLLFLDNSIAAEDFERHKHSALVALCVAEPKIVAECLTAQFYEPYHTVSRRLEMLDVLIESSQEIANPSKSVADKMRKLSLIPKEAVAAEEQWKTIIRERLAEKTRIIAKKPAEKETSVNQFSKVAGCFFFPLMRNYAGITTALSLREEDHYLIGKIIYTLAIVLCSAAQSWESRQMGKTLLDFLWAFRYHEDGYVRQAIIFSFTAILFSVPGPYLVDQLQAQLLEFQQWLVDVTKTEPNGVCVEKACQSLALLKNLVDQYLS